MDKKYYTDPPKIWAIALWLLFCSVAVLWVFTAPGKAEREPIKWLYPVCLGCFSLMYVRWYWNYPIVGRDSLILKNLLFSSKIYIYEDIEYLEMVCNNSKGTGLAGCHGGMCDAFRNSTEWQFMTGAQWVAHPGGDTVTYEVNMNKASSSPLISGIKDFSITSEQYYIHIDPAVDVLATTTFTFPGNHSSNGNTTIPVAFTKRWGDGKIYYNSLGHSAKTFDIPEALEMMRRGFLWAAR